MKQDPNNTMKERFFDLPIDLFCIIQLDNFNIIHANSGFEYILGWKPEEIIGNTLDIYTHSDEDKTVIEKAFSKISLGIHSLTFETEFHCKNNQVRWISWRGYVDTESHHLYVIGRDITPYKQAEKTLASQAHIDPLTGTFNRQTFMTVLQKEVTGAIQFHYATAIILVDIDHFESYNQRYGFQRGDLCLRQVASALKTCLRRKTDFLARFENDEFGIILSHNTLEKALKSAEYLRMNLEKMVIKHNNEESQHSITISLGVSVIPETNTKKITSDQLLHAASNALILSKQTGNQVNFVEEIT